MAVRGRVARRDIDRGLAIRMLVTLGLLTVVYGGFVALVVSFGRGSVALLLLALAVTVGLFAFSPRAALQALRVRPLATSDQPDLQERLRRLALLAGIPAPQLGYLESPVPNAFAIGYALTERSTARSTVVVTRRLLELLEPGELDGVLAHELAHLRNRDALVLSLTGGLAVAALVTAGIMTAIAVASGKLTQLTARLASRLVAPSSQQPVGCLRGCLGLNAALLAVSFAIYALCALLAAGLYLLVHGVSLLVVLALPRYREFVADRTAAQLTGDPAGLASALLKLDAALREASETDSRLLRPFRAFLVIDPQPDAWLGLLSTHPPVAERVRRLLELQRDFATGRSTA